MEILETEDLRGNRLVDTRWEGKLVMMFTIDLRARGWRKAPRMEPTFTSPDGLLSPRQKQIVTLMAEDFTAKEIGECLGVSPKTVEFHKDLPSGSDWA